MMPEPGQVFRCGPDGWWLESIEPRIYGTLTITADELERARSRTLAEAVVEYFDDESFSLTLEADVWPSFEALEEEAWSILWELRTR